MNGDIPNFAMGPRGEKPYVTGNLQEEVRIVFLLFSIAYLLFMCVFMFEGRRRQLNCDLVDDHLCLQEAKIMSEFH